MDITSEKNRKKFPVKGSGGLFKKSRLGKELKSINRGLYAWGPGKKICRRGQKPRKRKKARLGLGGGKRRGGELNGQNPHPERGEKKKIVSDRSTGGFPNKGQGRDAVKNGGKPGKDVGAKALRELNPPEGG